MLAHRQITQAFSDHSTPFWLWGKKGKGRDTLTRFPFVNLMVLERLMGWGCWLMGLFCWQGVGPISLCYSPERWRAGQDLISDQAFSMGQYKVWPNVFFPPFPPSSFNANLKADESERLQEKKISLLPFPLSSFIPFPESLISAAAPWSSPPWLSARPEQSLGILEFPLCSRSWLTYLFNYFTVCLLFKRRGPCCFFPSALLFKTQAFHVGPGLPGLMAVTSTFDLPWPPRRVW